MPELPEVESFRKSITKTSMEKKIEMISLASPGMLLNTSEAQLKKSLVGNQFLKTHRHGKFLFVSLKTGSHLMLHFGLSGDIVYVKPGEDQPTRYALRFHFTDDSDLYFTDPRKLGKISIVKDLELFIQDKGYGKDALEIGVKEFIGLIQKKKTAIKTALMDQKNVAGVGNEFSDEILFQTGIHPSSLAMNLSEKQLKDIYSTMVSILKEAIKYNANREKLTHYFFLENRKEGLDCPNCKGKTEFKTIGGRSSYFCPSCQKAF